MAIDFDKIDRSVDLKGLQADVEDAKISPPFPLASMK